MGALELGNADTAGVYHAGAMAALTLVLMC